MFLVEKIVPLLCLPISITQLENTKKKMKMKNEKETH